MVGWISNRKTQSVTQQVIRQPAATWAPSAADYWWFLMVGMGISSWNTILYSHWQVFGDWLLYFAVSILLLLCYTVRKQVYDVQKPQSEGVSNQAMMKTMNIFIFSKLFANKVNPSTGQLQKINEGFLIMFLLTSFLPANRLIWHVWKMYYSFTHIYAYIFSVRWPAFHNYIPVWCISWGSNAHIGRQSPVNKSVRGDLFWSRKARILCKHSKN